MNNTQFLKKVNDSMKEVQEVIGAVVITTVCVITTVNMIRDAFFKRSN